ncbi:MAG: FliH/SctL family protein [bacterium]|nr:FliH/SctL family protein [bacterium]
MGRGLSPNVYKSELLPPTGTEVILDIERKPEPEGRSILDVIEERVKRSQIKLLELQKEIKEATQTSRSLQEDVLSEAKKKAAEIINQANEKAEVILTQAKTQIAEIEQNAKEQAHQEGFDAGKEKGIKAGEESLKKMFSEIQNVLIEAKNKRAEIIHANQEMIVELAFMIAKKIIKAESITNKETLLKNLNAALKKLKDKEKIKVKLNPVYLAELGNMKERLLAQASGLEGITFEEDQNIEPGGCLIETNFGLIDATISSQLEVIQEALR